MKIMHVDASAKRERSNSRALSRHFLERLRDEGVDLEIDYLDVSMDTPPHVTEAFAIATYTAEHDRTPAMKATLAESDALCNRLLAADAFVFAMTCDHSWPIPGLPISMRWNARHHGGGSRSAARSVRPDRELAAFTKTFDFDCGRCRWCRN